LLELLYPFYAIPDAKPLRTLLELFYSFYAIQDAKPLRTFAGIALSDLAENEGRPSLLPCMVRRMMLATRLR
jgi:hypothetical protein